MIERSARPVLLIVLTLLVSACGGPPSGLSEETLVARSFYKPQIALEELFYDVQMARVFPDSKTFVDCVPMSDPSQILENYRKQKDQADFDLNQFVRANFRVPAIMQNAEYTFPDSLQDHIPAYWGNLVRQPEQSERWSTLISLPKSYVVPGGRFREIYYWDSYFTMQGLARSGRLDLIENMLDNFSYLIDTVGYIPNGNRTYFLGRSQPPFFGPMVSLLMDEKGIAAGERYLSQLVKEYNFWMEGKTTLTMDSSSYRRVVRMEDGTVLNRYYDDDPTPRPESFYEDVELASELDSASKTELYRNIRAACESGWDFSTRWFADNATIETIETTKIVPVDLNSLLLHLETTIALIYESIGESDQAEEYYAFASSRGAAIKKYLWDPERGYFQDYYFEDQTFTERITLAGMYPFYFDIADIEQIVPARKVLEDNFIKDGGVVTTVVNTGQQWDSPNGWAPLQWITIIGLAKYENVELANALAVQWLAVNQKVYSNTHKMMEKYNVEDLSLAAGGGEYPTQDGFGWSNGVAYALFSLTGKLENDE